MLNFAINVHHNVTQFPQDLTLHKLRRPGISICSAWEWKWQKNPSACECEYVNVNVSACLRVVMRCVRVRVRVQFACLIKSKGS